MKQIISAAQPHRRGLVSVLAVILLVAAACAPASPTATPSPIPTTTVPRPTATLAPSPTAPPTTAPTMAPSGLPAVHPAGTRTGIAEVDAVADAFLSNRREARRPLVRLLTTACTTAQGLGGPPTCAPGEADGTLVEVFPEATTEGTFFRRNEIDRILQFDVTGLYGVYRVPAFAFRADYWPAGDYAVVFAGPADPKQSVTGVIQTIVYVQDGSVVRLRRTPFAELWPPEEAKNANWILPPVP